jgi:aspartyl-tRNA(Asn)/glutamyl-tRNA(Gln) amidotransferase subunit A
MIAVVTGETWTGDACALVDAFRRGERSPREELEATLAAIANSDLNCFSYLDPEGALDAARRADTSLPFGGLPVGIKELEPVAGWPQTEGSLVFKDRVATETSTIVERLLGAGGAVPVGLTTASEFGGLNVSVTKLNGVTHNPWRLGRTTGGSSASRRKVARLFHAKSRHINLAGTLELSGAEGTVRGSVGTR